jgi:hypothetical protein
MSGELQVKAAGEVDARRAAIEAKAVEVLMEFPDGGEDGELRIYEQLLSATTLEEIDQPWAINGLGQFVGQVVQINSGTRMPSDYSEGFAWYLVLDAVVCETGEALAMPTSSRAIIMQVGMLRRLGLLPAKFIVRVADKPTDRGYYPQHLEVYREYHTARRSALPPAGDPQTARAQQPGYRPGENLARMRTGRRAAQDAAAEHNTAAMNQAMDQGQEAGDEPGF